MYLAAIEIRSVQSQQKVKRGNTAIELLQQGN